jgi:hypothetical protein
MALVAGTVIWHGRAIDLTLLESERFGPTRSRAEHVAALQAELRHRYQPNSAEPSIQSVKFMRRRWNHIRFSREQLAIARKALGKWKT